MKIVNRAPEETADISSGRGTLFNEFWKLVCAAAILLVVLFFVLGLLVDALVIFIPSKIEAKLFKTASWETKEPKQTEYQEQFERADKILDKLLQNSNLPPLNYRLFLIDSKDPNAFAFPGGSIGITTGLLAALSDNTESDGIEIAFVLGHELGHFSHRDHLRGLGRAFSITILTATLFHRSIGGDSFRKIINLVLQRRYSQVREKKADRFALELVHAVYSKVDGTSRLFEILDASKSIPKWAYMFSTHPAPRKRIEALDVYSKQL